ncbi:hypothetical protein GCM10010517_44730 [Streptosporangium fragile]|uniref:Uncharacterized protein n=1 Tax=Streptosporangium fragile TaxID=46186 RepID=A0ABP6IKR9_9ACTN
MPRNAAAPALDGGHPSEPGVFYEIFGIDRGAGRLPVHGFPAVSPGGRDRRAHPARLPRPDPAGAGAAGGGPGSAAHH